MSEHRIMKACPKCGAADRSPSGGCRPCNAAAAKRYAAANKEKIQAYEKRPDVAARRKSQRAENYKRTASAQSRRRTEILAADPKRYSKAAAAWRESHRESGRAASKAWKQKNPEAGRLYNHRRRAAVMLGKGKLSKGIVKKLFALQRGICPCCRQPLGRDFHLDHIIPLALGGANSDENVQLLRDTCNQEKATKHPVEFMQARGFLL